MPVQKKIGRTGSDLISIEVSKGLKLNEKELSNCSPGRKRPLTNGPNPVRLPPKV